MTQVHESPVVEGGRWVCFFVFLATLGHTVLRPDSAQGGPGFLVVGAAWIYFEWRRHLPTQHLMGLAFVSVIASMLFWKDYDFGQSRFWIYAAEWFFSMLLCRMVAKTVLHLFPATPNPGLWLLGMVPVLAMLFAASPLGLRNPIEIAAYGGVMLVLQAISFPLWVDKRNVPISWTWLPVVGWTLIHVPPMVTARGARIWLIAGSALLPALLAFVGSKRRTTAEGA